MHTLTLLCLIAAADQAPTDSSPRAVAFVTQLSRGEFAAAAADFDETMLKVLPAEKLKAVWESVTGQFGAYQKQTGTRTDTKDKLQIVFVSCQFEKRILDVRLVFNAEKKIAGLQVVPQAMPYTWPAYVQPDKFRDSDVVIGAGTPWALPGTLSLPVGPGPFPAVVLVHGSGANDRDEAIGPNKPFRDLAGGLASRGIAVLRYEKRTREHGAKLATDVAAVTVKEEVIDDALAAAALLRQTKGIDPQRVYILGHSLGGMLAPRIAALDSKLAGIVVMAGNTRPLEDLIVEQFTYLAKLGGEPEAVALEQLTKIKEQAAKVKDPKLSPTTPGSELPLGVPAPYWLSIRGYEPATVAAGLTMPVLVLHADRDYQVTQPDFDLWQKALAGQSRATLKHYEKLNHLFMTGEGKATPAEYEKEGHVAATVIGDIANWILR